MRTAIIPISKQIAIGLVHETVEAEIILSNVNRCIIKSVALKYEVVSYGNNTGVVKSVTGHIYLPTINYTPDSTIINTGTLAQEIGIDTNPLPLDTSINAGLTIPVIANLDLVAIATGNVDIIVSFIFVYEEIQVN
jgi:hypothetical protein